MNSTANPSILLADGHAQAGVSRLGCPRGKQVDQRHQLRGVSIGFCKRARRDRRRSRFSAPSASSPPPLSWAAHVLHSLLLHHIPDDSSRRGYRDSTVHGEGQHVLWPVRQPVCTCVCRLRHMQKCITLVVSSAPQRRPERLLLLDGSHS